jgi:hypothetical protein
MNKFILLIILMWQIPVYAESGEAQREKNVFDKVDAYFRASKPPEPGQDALDLGLPPPPAPRLRQSKQTKKITKYSSSIKPGDKLPDDVYECALKNIRGIGSDAAAAMVWQSCLRLHLE